MKAETLLVGTQRLGERGVSRRRTLHREDLLPDTRAEGDSIGAGRSLQRPERTRLVGVGITVGQVARPLLLFNQHTAAGQQLHQVGDALVEQRLQRFIGGCGYVDKDRITVSAPVHAVEHQTVQVDVQVRGRPETLDERDRAAVGLLGLHS